MTGIEFTINLQDNQVEFIDGDIVEDIRYYYVTTATDVNYNESEFAQEVSAIVEVVGVDNENSIPKEFALKQNYPNPFNPSTLIKYALSTAGEVSLLIYSLRGEKVAHLIDERKPAGNYTVEWNASNVSSGIYFYRLQAGDFVQTRKMVLLK